MIWKVAVRRWFHPLDGWFVQWTVQTTTLGEHTGFKPEPLWFMLWVAKRCEFQRLSVWNLNIRRSHVQTSGRAKHNFFDIGPFFMKIPSLESVFYTESKICSNISVLLHVCPSSKSVMRVGPVSVTDYVCYGVMDYIQIFTKKNYKNLYKKKFKKYICMSVE